MCRVKGNLQPDEPVAETLVYAVLPDSEAASIPGIEVERIRKFGATCVRALHGDFEWCVSAGRKCDLPQ